MAVASDDVPTIQHGQARTTRSAVAAAAHSSAAVAWHVAASAAVQPRAGVLARLR